MFCLASARQLPAPPHRNSAALPAKSRRRRAPTKAVPWHRNRHVAGTFSVSPLAPAPPPRCRRLPTGAPRRRRRFASGSHASYSCRILREARAASYKAGPEPYSSHRVKTKFIPDSLCLLEKRGSVEGGGGGGGGGGRKRRLGEGQSRPPSSPSPQTSLPPRSDYAAARMSAASR